MIANHPVDGAGHLSVEQFRPLYESLVEQGEVQVESIIRGEEQQQLTRKGVVFCLVCRLLVEKFRGKKLSKCLNMKK